MVHVAYLWLIFDQHTSVVQHLQAWMDLSHDAHVLTVYMV